MKKDGFVSKMQDIKDIIAEIAHLTEAELEKSLPAPDPDYPVLCESERYSLFSAGKRIRPVIAVLVCRMLGGSDEAVLPFAAALEMVHCYSLIHDDLPCMDDDDLRRGRPTNHRVFGEAIALLAGDALLTQAFAAAAGNRAVGPGQALKAVSLLSERSGGAGMVGGQVMDKLAENGSPGYRTMIGMHSRKTGALIRLAAELGAIAAGVGEDDPRYASVIEYSNCVGLVFQIVDDLLDAEGDAAETGKNTGQDEKDGKTTFLSFMDPDSARQYADELTSKAIASVSGIPGSGSLCELAQMLLKRKK